MYSIILLRLIVIILLKFDKFIIKRSALSFTYIFSFHFIYILLCTALAVILKTETAKNAPHLYIRNKISTDTNIFINLQKDNNRT